MGGFKRALFGYRRTDVEAALFLGETRILDLEHLVDLRQRAFSELEGETAGLMGMVLEREREIRCLNERLREANECHDRSIASLKAITSRLEEGEGQARGQAARILMKALREAVEVSKKVKQLTEIEPVLRAETEALAPTEPAA